MDREDQEDYGFFIRYLADDIGQDPYSPVTFGLPDLLSVTDREDQDRIVKEFIESRFLAIKKGKKRKIKLIPEMVRLIVDLFYGYKNSAILKKSRGCGGSVVVAILIFLRAIYRKTTFYILSGSQVQSGHIYEYVLGYLICVPEFSESVLDGEPTEERITFRSGVEIVHVPASQSASIGEQIPGIAIDEASTSDLKFEKLIQRAIPIIESSDIEDQCVILCSTMHNPTGYYQTVWDDAEELGYERYEWDIYDVMEKCTLPIDCKDCPLTDRKVVFDPERKVDVIEYPGCNGKARNSEGFRTFQQVLRTKKRHSHTDVWSIEYEGKRPGHSNKIYPKDIVDPCLVDEIKIFKNKPFVMSAGIDWGWTNLCAIAIMICQGVEVGTDAKEKPRMEPFLNLVSAFHFTQTLVKYIAEHLEVEFLKYGVPKEQVNIFADAEDLFNCNQLQEMGFEVYPVSFSICKNYAISNFSSWVRSRHFRMFRSYPRSGNLCYKQTIGYRKDEKGKPVKINDHYPDSEALAALGHNFIESGLVDLSEEDSEEETTSRVSII